MAHWTRYWLQLWKNHRIWREWTKASQRSQGRLNIDSLNRMSKDEEDWQYTQNTHLWKEWNRMNIAGRNAYCSGDYEEANRQFEALLATAGKLDFYRLQELPKHINESSRWWQVQIVRKGTSDN